MTPEGIDGEISLGRVAGVQPGLHPVAAATVLDARLTRLAGGKGIAARGSGDAALPPPGRLTSG